MTADRAGGLAEVLAPDPGRMHFDLVVLEEFLARHIVIAGPEVGELLVT